MVSILWKERAHARAPIGVWCLILPGDEPEGEPDRGELPEVPGVVVGGGEEDEELVVAVVEGLTG